MSSTVIAALLVTLAAGSASVLLVDRSLRHRSPSLLAAVVAHLVLFNLLTALGLGFRLVERNPVEVGGSAVALHLLSGQVVAISALKVAWLRSFVVLARTLAGRSLPRSLNRTAVTAAALAAGVGAAGWVMAAAVGDFALVAAVAVTTDLLVLGGIGWASTVLWRDSAAAAGLAGRKAMRWFAAGSLGVAVAVGLSLAVGAVVPAWGGPGQALGHALTLLAYESLLVVWAVRWAGAWAEERERDGGGHRMFDEMADRCGLSKREREVAALLCRGRTNQEIADALFVALQTVKDHNYRIFQKARVRNRTELARLFLGEGPSTPDR